MEILTLHTPGLTPTIPRLRCELRARDMDTYAGLVG